MFGWFKKDKKKYAISESTEGSIDTNLLDQAKEVLPPREISDNGIKLVKNFEGLSLKAYLCPAGVWTIGYGSTLGVKKGDRLEDEEEAEDLLLRDLMKFEDAVTKLVKVDLNQNQFDALVSFTYNVGIGAFKKSTLLKVLNMGKYDLVPDQFGRWIYANGKVLSGLKRRRAQEAALFIK